MAPAATPASCWVEGWRRVLLVVRGAQAGGGLQDAPHQHHRHGLERCGRQAGVSGRQRQGVHLEDGPPAAPHPCGQLRGAAGLQSAHCHAWPHGGDARDRQRVHHRVLRRERGGAHHPQVGQRPGLPGPGHGHGRGGDGPDLLRGEGAAGGGGRVVLAVPAGQERGRGRRLGVAVQDEVRHGHGGGGGQPQRGVGGRPHAGVSQ
mmetsp:Transcript_31402/g.80149  ORF Transcript_31402/g.80149 Transcript_31402/m.80149 type:complete len:204 (-) Transcript_31402:93-704(-)